jgi:hypothetical protein
MDSSSSSSPVKRAARTYGRAREPQQPLDSDSSVSHFAPSSSRSSAIPTGPKNALEEVPPTSDPEDASPNSKFEFAWKYRLRAIDEASDDDLPIFAGARDYSSSLADVSANTLTRDSSPIPTSPQIQHTKTRRILPPDPDSPIRARVLPTKPNQSLSESSPTSPEFSQDITPLTHTRTSTPPTSDAEQENSPLPTTRDVAEGKKRSDIAPLGLFDGGCSDSDQIQLVKEKCKGKKSRSKVKVGLQFITWAKFKAQYNTGPNEKRKTGNYNGGRPNHSRSACLYRAH